MGQVSEVWDVLHVQFSLLHIIILVILQTIFEFQEHWWVEVFEHDEVLVGEARHCAVVYGANCRSSLHTSDSRDLTEVITLVQLINKRQLLVTLVEWASLVLGSSISSLTLFNLECLSSIPNTLTQLRITALDEMVILEPRHSSDYF